MKTMFGRADIYSCLADDFVMVFHVTCKADKKDDTFVLDRADASFLSRVPGWRLCQRFTDQLDVIANTIVHPVDRDLFLRRSRREAILSELKGAKSYVIDFRLKVEGCTRYFTFKFCATHDRRGAVTGFVAGLQDGDAESRGERMDAAERFRRAMAFFSENYAFAFRRSLSDETFSFISGEDRFPIPLRANEGYSALIARFCEACVDESDRRQVEEGSSAADIRERLKDRTYFIVHLRKIAPDGKRRWWTMRVNRVEGVGDEVIIGFNDTDEDVRRDIDRETRLAAARENAIAMDRVLHALQSGSPLSDLATFIEIVRERFNAGGCCFVRHEFSSGLAFIDKGCMALREGLPATESLTIGLRAFEPQLMDLATLGMCEFDAVKTRDFFERCIAAGAPTFVKNVQHHVAMPVLVRGRLRGSLNIDFAEDRHLTDLELGNLRRLAEVLGAAIERREVYLSLEKAQREAARESEFVNSVINLIPMPCFVKDSTDDFRYIRCNDAFASLLMLKKEDIVGHTDWDIFDAKAIARVRSHDFAALESEGPISYVDELYVERDKAVRSLTCWKRKMAGVDGHVLILCVIGDFGQ